MKKHAKPTTPAVLRFRHFLIIFGFTAAAIFLSAYFLVACRVQTVTVENADIVPQATILGAADIQTGRHLYAISESKIASAVSGSSPYIKSVTIERKLPSTLQIFVEEYALSYYIEYEGRYYLLTDELLVLEETTPEDAIAKGAVFLMLPKIKDPETDKENPDAPKVLPTMETLTFETKTNKAWSLTLLSEIQKTALSEKITAIDISDPFALTLQIADKYTILLGNEKDFGKKLVRVERAIDYLSESMYGLTGILHAQQDAPVTFELTGVIENVDS